MTRRSWRVPVLAAVVVALVVAVVVVIQQRSGGTVTGSVGAGARPVTPPQFTAPTASRVKEYTSLDGLAADSTNIVIASPTGQTREAMFPGIADAEPLTYATLTVGSVVSGSDVSVGQQIEVWARDDDTVGRAMFSVPGDYLLFLAPALLGEDGQNPAGWDGQYSEVGIFAGLYFGDPGSEVFARADLDSPDLPVEVDTDGVDLMAGWYDAAYLDHVAAGEIPELMSPLQHRPGTVASPIIGRQAEPFRCSGAMTTAAAQTDDGTLVGLTDHRFCAAINGPDGPVTRGEELIFATPLRAAMRIGSAWQSAIAGVVDGSITAVVAIRGAEDAVNPDDPLPDWEVPLIELGDLRAFATDDSTRQIVGYVDGVEQFRWTAWPEFTEDTTGGWGDGLEICDGRDDLTGLVPAALTAWSAARH